MQDLLHNLNGVPMIAPVSGLVTTAPTCIADVPVGANDAVSVVLQFGAVSAQSVILKLQHAATSGGTYEDVPVGDLILPSGVTTNSATLAVGDANTVKPIFGYVGIKGFLKLVVVSGTMSGAISGMLVRGHPRFGPATA